MFCKKLLLLEDVHLDVIDKDTLGLPTVLGELVKGTVEGVQSTNLVHLHFQFLALLLNYTIEGQWNVREYSMRLRVSSHLLSCEA